ncbi:MAG: hypothetical protein R3346_03630 [Candidatus Spechtbacterales bacterium]|nr:hypothetical protein [Candidatus Spechtbacterales bacterium]
MTEEQIVSIVLVVMGSITAIRPDIMLRFQVWSQRVIMGAKYEPGVRTYKVMRIIGIVLTFLGFLAWFGILE